VSPSPSRTRVVVLALAFVAIAGVTAFRVVRDLNVAGQPHAPHYGMQDFRDAIYFPVIALLDGHNPYDVRDYLGRYPVGNKFPLYAPMALGVYLPFGMASQDHAAYGFLLLNLLLTLVLAYFALRIGGASPNPAAVLGVGALLLASHPGHMSAFIGQCTTYVVIGVYLAFLFARRRPWIAASGLALACLKPTFGGPAALLLLARGDARVVARALAMAAVASAIVSVPLAWAAGGIGSLVASLWGNYAMWDQTFVSSARSIFRIDALAFFGRLLGRNLTTVEDLALTTIIMGLGALGIRRLARAERDGGDVLSASLACVTILAGTYHQAYDGLILAGPAIAVAGGLGRGPARLVLAAAIALPAVNYLATDSAVERLQIEGASWVLLGSLNGAALLLAFGLVFWTALRNSPVPRR
jgi:hypothetical protein